MRFKWADVRIITMFLKYTRMARPVKDSLRPVRDFSDRLSTLHWCKKLKNSLNTKYPADVTGILQNEKKYLAVQKKQNFVKAFQYFLE